MTHAIDIKDLKKLFENKEPMTLLDVRRKADYQANPNTIKGAVWRDPEKIDHPNGYRRTPTAAGPGQGKLRPRYRLILYDLIGVRSIEKCT